MQKRRPIEEEILLPPNYFLPAILTFGAASRARLPHSLALSLTLRLRDVQLSACLAYLAYLCLPLCLPSRASLTLENKYDLIW